MNTEVKSAHYEKVWLKSYPQGMPEEVDINAFSSIVEVLESSTSRFADLPAFSNMGATLSYRDLEQKTRNFAAYLQQEVGIRKGDKVARPDGNLFLSSGNSDFSLKDVAFFLLVIMPVKAGYFFFPYGP